MFTAKIAAALLLASSLSAPVMASPAAELDAAVETAAPAQVEVAVYCEYVVVWDVWGNAYYEYYCY
jgi:hypothetical protein